jgi:hypothetical protein
LRIPSTWPAALVALVLVAGPTLAEAAPFALSFGTIPVSGAVAGAPGETVGWGYAIVNEDADHWLEVVALDADPFAHAAPGFPASLFDFPILPPASLRMVPWIPGTEGLYEFAFAPGTPDGSVNAGSFSITGTWWDADPIAGGAPVLEGVQASAGYSVTATGAAVVAEPATLFLVGSGVLSAALGRRRRNPRS